MKRLYPLIFVFAAAILVSAQSCAAGSLSRKTVPVDKFTKISATHGLKVIFTPMASGSPEVTVEAPSNQIDKIDVTISGSELSLAVKSQGSRIALNDIKIYVKAAGVTALSAQSAADILVNGDMKANVLNLSAVSSGEIEMKTAKASTVNITADSAGEISINTADAGTLNISTQSSGEVECMTMIASTLNVAAASAAEISAKAIDAGVTNISASSAAEMSAETLKCKTLNIDASSNSEVELNSAECNTTNINAQSGAELEIKTGNTAMCNIIANSGAKITLTGYRVGTAGTLKSSNSSTVRLNNPAVFK